MKAKIPFKTWRITQGFAQNLNTYYKEGGLAGHSGIDLVAVGDDTILNAIDNAYCYAVRNKNNEDLMAFRAVYTLVEIDGLYFEISYGHCDQIFAEVGKTYNTGDKLATQGNTGDVAVGGKKVTLEQKKGGSQMGEHLHWQFRLVKPVVLQDKKKAYLYSDTGILKKDRYLYEIVDYQNGFNGCVDPSPFVQWKSAYSLKNVLNEIINPTPKTITKTLRYGSTGEQVKTLQEILGITKDGIFGVRTDTAVRNFQKYHKLVADGIVGEKTREKLHNI